MCAEGFKGNQGDALGIKVTLSWVLGRLTLFGVLCALGLVVASSASADVTFCEVKGSAAGQCSSPSSVAVDSGAGIVYVADTANNRIDAFGVDGSFLWAFGLGVAGGSSETLQTCASSCEKGKEPSGFVPQEVGAPSSVTVDSVSGAVYVFSKLAVRKFTIDDNGTAGDPSDDFAVFERLWGGGVVRSGAAGTGNLSSGSATVTNVKTTSKRFLIGQPITGTGIAAETKIEALGNETITLSKAAEASGTSVALSAPDGVGNVPSDEVQELAYTSKTPFFKTPFKLTFSTPNPSPSSATTASIPIEASGAEVQAALVALPNVDPGDVTVTGPGGAPGEAGGPWVVSFAGRFTDVDVDGLAFTAQDNHSVTTLVTGGAGPEVCTLANLGDCVAPKVGTGPGQFSSLGGTSSTAQLAAKPGGGVVVGDSFGTLVTGIKGRVQRFDASGALVGEQCPTGDARPAGIQVATDSAGNVYVTGRDSGASVVRKLDSSCNQVASFASPSANALATDSADDLFVADSFEDLMAIYEHNAAGAPIHTFYGNGTLKDQVLSVAPYQGDLFVIEDSAPRRLARIEEEPPGPVVVPFSNLVEPIGNVKATLRARINPEGKATTFHFEYVDDASFQSEGGFSSPHTHISAESASIGSDFESHEVSFAIVCPEPEVELAQKIEAGECLEASTKYHYRVVATNADGEAEGEEGSFITLPPVQLGPLWSTAVGTDSARLHGEVNPVGLPATIEFEYVEEAAYLKDLGEGGDGFAEATHTPPLSLGTESAFVEKSALASQLKPDTAYRFRYVAHDFFGDFTSPTRGFSTLPVGGAAKPCPNEAFRTGPGANLPDCRAYELVSPLDKEGGDIVTPAEATIYAFGFVPGLLDQATPSGDGLTFTSYRGFAGAESVPLFSQYIARRDPSTGWSTRSVNAPRQGPSTLALSVLETLIHGFSEDLCSHWFTQDTDLALAPGAPAGVPNLYRRGDCGEEAEYELLSTTQPPGFDKEAEKESANVAALGGFSVDGSVAAFRSPGALTPEAQTVPVGEKLNCLAETPQGGETFTFEWLRNAEEVKSAKGSAEYTTKNADAGKAVQCRVSVSGLSTGEVRVANPAQIVAPFPASLPPIAPALIAAPTTSAPLDLGGGGGQTLSCNPNEAKWENESGFAYQWYRNGAPILTATASTYAVQASDVANAAVFQCAVTGENPEGTKVTKASETLATNPAPSPAPSDPDPRVLDVYRVYLHDEGGLHLVSVLPAGRPATTHAAVGTALNIPHKHRFDSVVGAVSGDGSRVFWSAQVAEPSVPAHRHPVGAVPSRLYLRVNPAQPQSAFEHGAALGTGKAASGSSTITSLKTTSATPFEAGQTVRGQGIPFGTKILTATASSLTLSAPATESVGEGQLEAFSQCSEAGKACTIPISDKAALFRAANPSATKALYSEGEDLYEVDVEKAIAGEAGAVTKVAGKVKGLMGESKDLARIYLVSGEDLDGAGPAEEGKFNLYLREAGGFTFVAALSGAGWALEPAVNAPASADVLSISPFPVNRSSRVSADGEQAVFMSESPALAEEVAGYDNADAVSGKADAEVYLYDAGEGELRCVSCNPSGARPQGAPLKKSEEKTWAAASIRGWETQWYPTRIIAEGGGKLFFNSFEALVARDTNGKQDVYEWERADSKKECEELGAERFAPSAGGCLSMISSGKSSTDAELIDSSASGRDVFFSTDSSLLPQDYGLVDIYDAREGGGFPPPPTPQPPCEGEACQPSPAPPQFQTPASQSFEGQGNVTEATKSQKHKKHKHKKKRHPKKHKRAGGRAQR